MNSLLKFGKHYAIPAAFAFATQFSVQAQSPVESTHIDEKYAYTTIVYKNAAASDKDVLSAVENDFGIGDVVRVSLAPPPTAPSAIAASEPVYTDKNKGEDAWMPKAAKSTATLTAANQLSPASQLSAKTMATTPLPAKVATTNASPKPILAAKTTVASTPVAVAPVQAEKAIETAVSTASNTNKSVKTKASGKATKAHKSVKKSGKKSGQKMKFKNRKHGKQHYSCPKF